MLYEHMKTLPLSIITSLRNHNIKDGNGTNLGVVLPLIKFEIIILQKLSIEI